MAWWDKVVDWVEDLFDGDDNESSSSKNTTTYNKQYYESQARLTGDTVINTMVYDSNKKKEYYVVKDKAGNYYYMDGTKKNLITDKNTISALKNNRSESITMNTATGATDIYKPTNNQTAKQPTSNNQNTAKPSTSTNKTSTSTNNVSSTPTTTSATSGGTDYKQLYEEQKAINASNTKRIEELENPKILSAQDVANILGIDYNEANILKDYNKATNEYYDAAIDELQGIRTDYDKNNTQYLDQIMDSYLDSYKHAAPTATGKGALAANALSTLLGAAQTNSINDYGVLQDINLSNEARKKELANNPNLARQQYNDLGLALSGLSTQFDKAKTLAAINQYDAYGKYYAADQSYRSQLANAMASKYSGLANASGTYASNTANNYNNQYKNILDVYFGATGSLGQARNAISNLITETQGK